jgi:hypothetical protein
LKPFFIGAPFAWVRQLFVKMYSNLVLQGLDQQAAYAAHLDNLLKNMAKWTATDEAGWAHFWGR